MKTTSIIPTYLARAAMTLLMLLTLAQGAWATKFITDVMVIGGTLDEVNALKSTYEGQGWTVINKDLNAGCGSNSDYIFLLYKTADNYTTADLTFITGFYITNASGTVPETYSYNGHTYHLVPYEGGEHFEELQGDLNSKAKGDYIHLYYTKEKLSSGNSNYDAVTSITFNNSHNGAVGVNGGTAGYDLNKGSGSGSEYIYMHPGTATAHKWTLNKNSNGTTCSITGANYGDDASQVLSVPAIIEGAVVTSINNNVNFTQFSNLETFYFSNSIAITTMPSLNNCKKFTQVIIVDNNAEVLKTNVLPSTITSIPDNTFRNTRLTSLSMPNVSSIGASAFYGCSSLSSATFSNVSSIGASAFEGCSSLTKVTIPNSVTSIDEKTFYGCTSLAKVTIPQSVKTIGVKAFSGCTGMTYVFMPNSLTSIGDDAFYGCTALQQVNISNIAVWCNISFGNAASNPLSYSHELYLNGHRKTDLALPSSVTIIKDRVFYGCSGLVSITFPSSVTCIGSEAFCGCSGLTSINIPYDVTSIGYKSFYGCSGLSSLTIPYKVTSIDVSAFENCSGLISVSIPNSVTSIGDNAFKGCTALSVLNGLRYADTYLVEAVDNSRSQYKIQKGTRFVGNDAFNGCSNMTAIYIPNSVTNLGPRAFNGCSGLTSFTIPSRVTHIGHDCFLGCTSVTDVYCYAKPSLYWDDGECNDFMAGKKTKCHVFMDTFWNEIGRYVNVTFVNDLSVRLEDNIDNTDIIEEFSENSYDITLVGRTLYKDGRWNTLCLPFGFDQFAYSPLEGATVMTLESSSFANDTLTLNFSTATSITAGTPFIVKWDQADDYVNDNAHNIFEPTFLYMNMDEELHPVDQAAIDFIGSYSPVSLAKDDRTVLYIGDDNKLHYPNAATRINAFRGWFQLANALPETRRGDVNGDESISVSDVSLLVNYILGQKDDNFIIENADVNGDGSISVSDVMALVNIILGENSSINVVVTGAEGLNYGGGGSGPARVAGNHQDD